MIFRRIKAHVEKENWFAVVIDFFIVIVGILIAFQITNWNEERLNQREERAILTQLYSEFLGIKSHLERQVLARTAWVDDIALLITILEGNAEEDEAAIKSGLDSATGVGRLPMQSAAYAQLMASGRLGLISNEELRQGLINFEYRIERDAFLHPELVAFATSELSENTFVDRNVLRRSRGSAAIDNKPSQTSSAQDIRAYDLKGLRQLENKFESIYVLQISQLDVEEALLAMTNEILSLIKNERK